MFDHSKLFPSHLPIPDKNALQHSLKVAQHLYKIIQQQYTKKVSYASYMNECLYASGLGYYSAGNTKFGESGDFTTAPEMSSLFARTLANFCIEWLEKLENPAIIEFGAGTGHLAADILIELQNQNCLPDKYMIIEISGELRERQKLHFLKRCPELLSKVEWLDRLPQIKYNGIIIANELLDAMPVTRFLWDQKKLQEAYVCYENESFVWDWQPASLELEEKFNQEIHPYLNISVLYESEVNMLLQAWFNAIVDFLQKGILLLIDYGGLNNEYYHPNKFKGSLRCYYRHRLHDNPLILPGIQDITADVNFSDVMECATRAGLTVHSYQSQAKFLINYGILQTAEKQNLGVLEQYQQAQALKQLLLPSEMGERFKALVLKSQAFSCP